MDRPTWPGQGAGSTSGSGEEARTRAHGSRSGTHGGLSSGRRAWVPGERVGPFVVKALLGQGGMGAVYTVTHETTGVDYALKVLLAVEDAMGRARFEREGQAQASLPPHPNVVRVFGAGELQGVPYLLTELAPGGDLRDRLRQGPLPPLEACGLFAGLARALEHLHARGVLHRDLKPHNIVFGADGAPKLMDFGLATLRGADKLTVTGAFMGTPNYMAPEQVDGQKVDARADVYGLGATLYQALCGRPPYDGESGVNMITKILTQPPRSLRSMQPDLPADVVRVVERSMARELEARYPSAGALADDLQRIAHGQPLDPPPPTPGSRHKVLFAAGAVVLLGTLAAGTAVALANRPPPPVSPPPAPSLTTAASPTSSTPPADPRAGRPAPYAVRFVDTATTSLLPPAWLAPSEELAPRGKGTPALSTPEVPLAPGANVFVLREREGKKALGTWHVVRLPVGVRVHPDSPQGTRALHDGDGSRLVYVPEAADGPAFLLGEREVTWAQYRRFAQATGRPLTYRNEKGEQVEMTRAVRAVPEDPMSNVVYEDVRAYCERLGLRIPAKEEWLRAYEGEGGPYPAGQGRSLPARGNIDRQRGKFSPQHVGATPEDVTWCGALDMYGNVQEWCLLEFGLGMSCGGSYEETSSRANQRFRQVALDQAQGYRGFRVVCDLLRETAPAPLD